MLPDLVWSLSGGRRGSAASAALSTVSSVEWERRLYVDGWLAPMARVLRRYGLPASPRPSEVLP